MTFVAYLIFPGYFQVFSNTCTLIFPGYFKTIFKFPDFSLHGFLLVAIFPDFPDFSLSNVFTNFMLFWHFKTTVIFLFI